jgi:hypothetical protein
MESKEGGNKVAQVEVSKLREGEFKVRVVEGGSESTHRVSVKSTDCERLTGGKATPEDLVRRSFEFLLEHEPKESILGEFDLMLIARYFPQYEREIKQRLAKSK